MHAETFFAQTSEIARALDHEAAERMAAGLARLRDRKGPLSRSSARVQGSGMSLNENRIGISTTEAGVR